MSWYGVAIIAYIFTNVREKFIINNCWQGRL